MDLDHYWSTGDGRVIKITEMTDVHLFNAIRYMRQKVAERIFSISQEYIEQGLGSAPRVSPSEVIEMVFPAYKHMVEELNRRNIVKDGIEKATPGTRILDI